VTIWGGIGKVFVWFHAVWIDIHRPEPHPPRSHKWDAPLGRQGCPGDIAGAAPAVASDRKGWDTNYGHHATGAPPLVLREVLTPEACRLTGGGLAPSRLFEANPKLKKSVGTYYLIVPRCEQG
jgi:hypothetical protein